jgi:tRNA(adenine34) deaminase
MNRYWKACARLAQKAAEQGNSPVGCVVVELSSGKVVASAWEAARSKSDLSYHAEFRAVTKAARKLGKDLSGCALYSTHEPCVMCAYPIRFHGIRQLYLTEPSQWLGSFSSAFNLLTSLDVPPHWPPPPEVFFVSLKEADLH